MNLNPATTLKNCSICSKNLDAQIGAIIKMLKDRGLTTSEEFARHVQKADIASDVRERGLRVRMEFLFFDRHQAERRIASPLLGRPAGISSTTAALATPPCGENHGILETIAPGDLPSGHLFHH